MNPFDLPGPAFLLLYAAVFAAGLALAAFLRGRSRGPGPGPPSEPPALDPYEMAYLADGPRRAVDAALTRLVRDGVLRMEGRPRRLVCQGDLPPGAHPLEKCLRPSSRAKSGRIAEELRRRATAQMEPIRARLRKLGLVVGRVPLLPPAVMLGVALFGLIKVVVGAARDKPVGFLVLACIGTVLVALKGFGRPVHRTRRGDRVLAQLKREHAALRETAGARRGDLPSADLSLAVGLFGLGLLAKGPLTGLQTLLRPPSPPAGGGDGVGGGCGGGGCGGGGCGGCGG
jgi:uncharacterized protein (TIGR04222 family)